MRKRQLTHRTVANRCQMGIAAAVLMACALFPGASLAMGTSEQRAACTSDVMRLCTGQLTSEGRVIACMKKNYGQLSARCKATLPKHPPG
jgi:hypothetical protein